MLAVKIDCVIVFARCGKWVVIVALVLMTGLHWTLLQTVAWTTMLADHLCQQNFTEAVSETFDGKHLCPLCKAIAAAKKTEKKSAAVSPAQKFEFFLSTEKFTFISPKSSVQFSASNFSADTFFPQPPVPPPRSCFV